MDNAQRITEVSENEALMLWLQKSEKLMENIEDGIKHFESKYGLKPNICIIHPEAAAVGEDETLEQTHDLHVATAKWVLPKHCLIGIVSTTDSVWGIPF